MARVLPGPAIRCAEAAATKQPIAPRKSTFHAGQRLAPCVSAQTPRGLLYFCAPTLVKAKGGGAISTKKTQIWAARTGKFARYTILFHFCVLKLVKATGVGAISTFLKKLLSKPHHDHAGPRNPNPTKCPLCEFCSISASRNWIMLHA